MEKPPIDNTITIAWAFWFNRLWEVAGDLDGHGTTAHRPTKGLYIGRVFFDDTLGYQIVVKTINPVVWVDGVGNPV